MPWGKAAFRQAEGAQPVSSAAAALQAYVEDRFDHGPLRVLDLACGSGIIAVMLGLQRPAWNISGLDIQAHLIGLAQSNAANLGLRIDFFEADLRSFRAAEAYELIVANPPWLKAGSGLASLDIARELSRREISCTAADVMSCLKRNLQPGGEAVLVYPASRLDELKSLAGNYLLDIIQALPTAETNKYLIYHFKLRG